MYCQNYLGNASYGAQRNIPITANSGSNSDPKIYNDTIVYQSNRNGNWDIYMYNITSKVETQITNNTADQLAPQVYGNIIVWQDYRDETWDASHWHALGWDIYMYNLTSHAEKRLPLPAQNAYSPRISGDSVVYAAENYAPYPNGGAEVYPSVCSYNLSTGLVTTVITFASNMRGGSGISSDSIVPIDSVSVGGSLVVWSLGSVIGVENLSSNSTWQSPAGTYKNPVVDGGRFVVYQSYAAGYWHLYVYDSSNGRLDQATTAHGDQVNPAIFSKDASIIVYQDDSSGGWHIYYTSFWYSDAMPPLVGSSNPLATSITPSGNAAGSGNQDLTIIVVVGVVSVAATLAVVFVAIRRGKPKKQELLHAPHVSHKP
jgi:beta propeller repeat protein